MTQPKFTITVYDGEGGELEIELPSKFVVCHRCQGCGTHVNPAIDGNGLTAEDFADDPDFHEAYMSGAYDQTCSVCKGERVISVVDRNRLTPGQKKQLKRYEAIEEQAARDDASEAWLRRAESGERW